MFTGSVLVSRGVYEFQVYNLKGSVSIGGSAMFWGAVMVAISMVSWYVLVVLSAISVLSVIFAECIRLGLFAIVGLAVKDVKYAMIARYVAFPATNKSSAMVGSIHWPK